jgi:hypothetical protein
VRLLLSYEDDNGSFRVTRFEMDVACKPVITCRNVRMLPVAGSLTDWRLAVTVAGSQHADTLSKIFTLHMKELLLQTNSWEVVQSGSDTSQIGAADEGNGFSDVRGRLGDAVVASKPVHKALCEGDSSEPLTVEMVVRRKEPVNANVESMRAQRRAEEKDVFNVFVVWDMQGSQAGPRVGLSALPGVRPLELIQDTAVRLVAEVRGCEGVDDFAEEKRRGPGGLMVLNAAQGPLGHTDVQLVVKLRNNSNHSVTLCVEFGDLVPQGRRTTAERAGSISSHRSGLAAGALVALPQSPRHHWLGAVRRHVQELKSVSECEVPARVRLLGCGPFSVQDYVCTWRVTTGPIVNRTTQGPVLAFMVGPEQKAVQSREPIAEALAQPGSASLGSLQDSSLL